jgi:peptide/nickel transport system permease protein
MPILAGRALAAGRIDWIGITLMLFVVTHVVPVNPLAVILTERSMEDPEAVAAATARWGLDKSLPEYLIHLRISFRDLHT